MQCRNPRRGKPEPEADREDETMLDQRDRKDACSAQPNRGEQCELSTALKQVARRDHTQPERAEHDAQTT